MARTARAAFTKSLPVPVWLQYFEKCTSGLGHLKLSVEITLPLIPSHQGRGEYIETPSPLVGEGRGEGCQNVLS